MEKGKPTYDLSSFREVAGDQDRTLFTATAMRSALFLGFSREDMVATIQGMRPNHFYKSMTSNRDYKIWQDVYHVPSQAGTLYIKFCSGTITEFTLLSFKEKSHG